MTRYEILANALSDMLHEELGAYENKLLLMEPADILDHAYEYVVKIDFVSVIDDLLDSQLLDEDEIVVLINTSLDMLYDFYEKGYDRDVTSSYSKCIAGFCLEAKEK